MLLPSSEKRSVRQKRVEGLQFVRPDLARDRLATGPHQKNAERRKQRKDDHIGIRDEGIKVGYPP
jgi:hypothetical protein